MQRRYPRFCADSANERRKKERENDGEQIKRRMERKGVGRDEEAANGL